MVHGSPTMAAPVERLLILSVLAMAMSKAQIDPGNIQTLVSGPEQDVAQRHCCRAGLAPRQSRGSNVGDDATVSSSSCSPPMPTKRRLGWGVRHPRPIAKKDAVTSVLVRAVVEVDEPTVHYVAASIEIGATSSLHSPRKQQHGRRHDRLLSEYQLAKLCE
jgi:hypothetical protein